MRAIWLDFRSLRTLPRRLLDIVVKEHRQEEFALTRYRVNSGGA